MNLAKKLLMTTGEAAGGNIPSGGYVDDVFSTYLYTGNGSSQTINNGIDLAGKGGLVWIKGRSGATDHALYDTARGATLDLVSNSTAGQITQSTGLTTFGNSGFSVGSLAKLNTNSSTYASWAFRRVLKFFDVVTYTGNGVAGQQIAHSLGVQAGFITVKATSTTGDWNSYHRSATGDLKLNTTDAQTASRAIITAADASAFTVSGAANTNGVQYVAYLFAHDPSAEGIIQCGSFTGNGAAAGPVVTLGWEPQYLMIKNASGTGNWQIIDSMRGMPVGSADATLQANLSNAESSVDYVSPTATGFQVTSTSSEVNASGSTYIYMTIRRPNKPPTSGTQVYNAIARTGTGAEAKVTGVGFAPDVGFIRGRTSGGLPLVNDKLRGPQRDLFTSTTAAEVSTNLTTLSFLMDGVSLGTDSGCNSNGQTYINHFFRRAPGFFDVVCYTGGTGYVYHSLGVQPEFIIVKARTLSSGWEVKVKDARYADYWSDSSDYANQFRLDSDAKVQKWDWYDNYITASFFNPGTIGSYSDYAGPLVAYLFASLPGISKVGTYRGNGGTQTISCGFTTGSRFILIKRIDNTGDWFVWDTTRGITPTTDPHLSLNTTAVEVTTDDSIDQDASGFVVNQNAATNINVLNGNYLFLAIA